MGDKTGIEWTDATWNPIRGCSRVSAGCMNCYAERDAHRFRDPGLPYEGLTHLVNGKPTWNGTVRLVPELLDQPLRWRRPRRIFVNSMSDLFHEGVPDNFIDQVFAVMALAPRHTFQVLTKRPGRMLEYLTAKLGNRVPSRWDLIVGHAWKMLGHPQMKKYAHDAVFRRPWPLPNVWLGVSVENQETANERIPLLLRTPATVRWISAEPLLGPVNIELAQCSCPWPADAIRTRHLLGCLADTRRPDDQRRWARLHWVVAGGESGPGARPSHQDWFRSLRDQCAAARVAFHFKQWGEWLGAGQDGNPDRDEQEINASDVAIRSGKKAAGRLLDGRLHDEYPEQST